MTYLLATYWLPLLLALALGAAIGFYTFARVPSDRWWSHCPSWLRAAGLVFVVGLVVALLHWLPGLAGLYLETALLLFAAYLIGCLLGSFLASLAPRDKAAAVTELPILNVDDYPGLRPPALTGADAVFDDLKRISGIGEQNEERLHLVGIWYFRQIADWSDENVAWISSYLDLPGYVAKDQWVEQARSLAQNLDTDYTKRVDWKWLLRK
ncbi:hypothetical protein [Beijerinckia indica]|uniref:Uncharacterized protein n=1 Tax=Beijerinckia indica subsp. indica (strain ATCC 9039 / DSM 1715 / NCIMB 8712) TaxID=395963 RepID=B2IJ76_BEII9|nr:hypothetical protein [Beijerinckia indica]ACB94839.1 conserved hypothetical protein [Beijerinckia indica subsp. indica ATCC 9039]